MSKLKGEEERGVRIMNRKGTKGEKERSMKKMTGKIVERKIK